MTDIKLILNIQLFAEGAEEGGNEMQNAECTVQSDDEVQNAECKMQNEGAEPSLNSRGETNEEGESDVLNDEAGIEDDEVLQKIQKRKNSFVKERSV